MFAKSHLQSYQFEEQQFSLWLTSAQGAAFIQQEQQQLALLMPKTFGHYSVHIGLNASTSAAAESPIKQAIALTANYDLGGHGLMDPHQLPLATEAIDLVVLQHALDISEYPHQVVREAARVVNAGGRLVITGFNPYGIWGLKRWLLLGRGMPWRARFLNQNRLKDWLTLLNFGDFDIKPVYDCAPQPWRSNPWLCWVARPISSGYILTAVKQETRVHMLKTQWRNPMIKPAFGLSGATRNNRS